MNPMISVIIPVYQAEPYLHQCIDSVLAQTQEGIEIVLVDDGSTDDSPRICDTYASEYEQIQVIHKENAGLTAAWKSGALAAAGEYVGFVDSDDWITSDMYEKLYQKAVETGADIVCCGIYHIFEDGDHEPWKDEMLFPRDVYTGEEMQREVYPSFINDGSFMGRGLQPNRVSKLLKRDLIWRNMALCKDDVTVGEDYQFSLLMFLNASKIAILHGFFPYYYRINKKSMTGQYDTAYMGKIKKMKKQLLAIGAEKQKYDFSKQIINDFLCLTVLHAKGGIVFHKQQGYLSCKKDLNTICTDPEVAKALREYHMPKLTPAEKLFLFWMKHHCYYWMYLSVCIYFR